MTTGGRAAAATLLAFAVVAVQAPPADAHTTGGLQPTNYVTVVRGVTPAIRGVSVRATDLGTFIELTNTTAREVTVLGYDNEPYLRVGPRGVFENERSPAVPLNRTTKPTGAVPTGYDAHATPTWRKLSSGTTIRWHDHRTHWMGGSDPPIVQRARGARHTVIPEWQVPLAINGREASIRGSVLWIPAPSPLPWLLVAAALAVAVAALHRLATWRWIMLGTLALLVVSSGIDVVGSWAASSAAAGSKIASGSYSAMSLLLGAAMIVSMLRSKWRRAVPAVLFTGFSLFVVTGLGNVGLLLSSQLPTTAPAWLARTVATVGLGAGAGLMIGAATHLKLDDDAGLSAETLTS